MKNLKILVLLAGMAMLASCQKEFEYVFAEKGPDMTVNSCDDAVYMGAGIDFSVDLQDADFALSTLKAELYYAETMVNSVTIRTRENGTYTETLAAPLLPDYNDGVATLIFIGQNVGQGVTRDTLAVKVTRPDFDKLTLHVGEAEYTMDRVDPEGYKYSVTAEFPAEADATITTPAVNEAGDVITLGWDGSALAVDGDPIPFSQKNAGVYTISVDLMTLQAEPFGYINIGLSETETEVVANLIQGASLKFPGISGVEMWDLDPDFFKLEDDNSITFLPVNGLYRIKAVTANKFLKVEAMADKDNVAVLNDDGTGAIWLIGAGVGKPSVGPSWNTDDGAWCCAQVSPKVYQITFAGGASIALEGADFKFYGEKGWGGEFTADRFSCGEKWLDTFEVDPSSGNIKAVEPLKSGQYYRLTMDLTAGVNNGVLSVEAIESPVSTLDITFEGQKASRVSADMYTVASVDLKKGDAVELSGVESMYVDPDYFTGTFGDMKFNASDGKYRVEIHPLSGYMELFRLKDDGTEATLSEGALWILAWGLGNPVMTNQIGFDEKTAYCLAEVEPLVFQFTGTAVEEKDGTTMGGRFRYDYISAKYFAQNAWGNEAGKIFGTATKVQLEGNCADYLKLSDTYNIELADVEAKPLELGATYRLTIDLSKAQSEGMEIVRFDKL